MDIKDVAGTIIGKKKNGNGLVYFVVDEKAIPIKVPNKNRIWDQLFYRPDPVPCYTAWLETEEGKRTIIPPKTWDEDPKDKDTWVNRHNSTIYRETILLHAYTSVFSSRGIDPVVILANGSQIKLSEIEINRLKHHELVCNSKIQTDDSGFLNELITELVIYQCWSWDPNIKFHHKQILQTVRTLFNQKVANDE